MRFSIVISTHQASFEAVSFKGAVEDSLAAVAQAGYDGAELAVRNAAEVDGAHLKEIAHHLNLQIPAIGTGQMWGDEGLSLTAVDSGVRHTAIERINQHISLAAELNALVIIGLVRGVASPAEYTETARAWLVDGLRAIGDVAKAAGVRVAIEAINRYETTYINTVTQGLAIIDQVKSEAIGLLLDSFHMNIEEPSMVESIRIAGDRLFHFHVADSNRWYPGAGHIDFDALLRELEAIQYSGWVSGEYLPLPDAETSIERGLEYMQHVASRL